MNQINLKCIHAVETNRHKQPNQKHHNAHGQRTQIMTHATLSELISDTSELFNGSKLRAYSAVKAAGKAAGKSTDISVWQEIFDRYSMPGSTDILNKYAATSEGSWLEFVANDSESLADGYLDAFADSGKRSIDRDRLNILLRSGR
jgi:protein involved in sex pheromone biosynthesis